MPGIPRHYIVAASAWVCRGGIAAIQLVSIRLLTVMLGTELYAMYALLTALLPWFQLSDFGIGISLQNFISEKRARNESSSAYYAAAAVFLLTISIILLALFHFLSSPISSHYLAVISPSTPQETKIYAIRIAISCSILNGIGGVCYKIWYGEQKGHLTNLVQGIAAFTWLAALWYISGSGASGEQLLVPALYAFFLPQSIVPLAILLVQMKASGSSWFVFDREVLYNITRRSSKFFFFGIMAAITLQIDYVVMAQTLKSSDIVAYNLCSKIFMMIFFIYNAVIIALWPTCAEALARKEWDFVKRQVARHIYIGVTYIVLATIIFSFSAKILFSLLSPSTDVSVPVGFIILCGIYHLVRVWCDTYAMVLQSISYLRPFFVLVPFQALLSASLQFYLAPILGIYGIITGLTASFLLTVGWGLPVAMRSISKKGFNT